MASDVETGAATDKWALYSDGFYMRAADGEDGKLARLVDVRDWLMRRHEWPMDRAANEVISALNQGVENGCALFIADTKRYAVAMREDAHFLSLDEIKERGGLRHIDERLLGFKGLCNAILNGWVGEYAGYLHSGRLDAACVTLKDAQELWGWGTAVTDAVAPPVPSAPVLALVPTETNNTEAPISGSSPLRKDRKAQAGEWTGERLAEKRKTLKGRDTTQQLAKLTGLPAREITRREKQARDDAAQALKAGNRASGMAA